ncbi:MAG: YggS family pyridoxal phosphate-dependent enzyme [Thiomicrorhabdus sp.]|nr:YggS family pyridoxal phosphate-dependent enzyme [Thiomicrorhabdus sp.]
MSKSLIKRYQTVQQRIQVACLQANRLEKSVSLLAVSKTKPVEDIIQLAKYGQSCFGENYLQESLLKIERCPALEWHFIGPIQSNKTKAIAEHFQWVHSIDRLKIAQRLSQQRPEGMEPLNILLEVNINNEASKAGFSPTGLLEIAPEIARLPNLRLRGLMAIPQKLEGDITFEAQRKPFAKVRQLLEQLNQTHGWSLDTLSMGMSADLEAAIIEGATMVRIGTDIFGKR